MREYKVTTIFSDYQVNFTVYAKNRTQAREKAMREAYHVAYELKEMWFRVIVDYVRWSV